MKETPTIMIGYDEHKAEVNQRESENYAAMQENKDLHKETVLFAEMQREKQREINFLLNKGK